MGFWELIVIAIVALLVLGPEKLPEAAKTLSKGIRDFRKQTRELQQTIEADEEIGGAIRDIQSALRGEEPRSPRPPVRARPHADGPAADTPGAADRAATPESAAVAGQDPDAARDAHQPDAAAAAPGDAPPADVSEPGAADAPVQLRTAAEAVPRSDAGVLGGADAAGSEDATRAAGATSAAAPGSEPGDADPDGAPPSAPDQRHG